MVRINVNVEPQNVSGFYKDLVIENSVVSVFEIFEVFIITDVPNNVAVFKGTSVAVVKKNASNVEERIN